MNTFEQIQNILRTRAELRAKLALIPYDGTVEIKSISEKKYIYVRKRVAGRVSSKYVDPFSDELYNLLLRNSKEAKELRKRIPFDKLSEFKEKLVLYYEDKDLNAVRDFLKDCWVKL